MRVYQLSSNVSDCITRYPRFIANVKVIASKKKYNLALIRRRSASDSTFFQVNSNLANEMHPQWEPSDRCWSHYPTSTGRKVVRFARGFVIGENSSVIGLVMSNRSTCCYRPRNVVSQKRSHSSPTSKTKAVASGECRANILWAISRRLWNSFDFIPVVR